jgi:hypothetical protein
MEVRIVGTMSNYCKAYYVKRFREYPQWSEREVAGLHTELLEEAEASRPLSDDDVLFLHDNYHVTDGVFADEHVVFAAVTPEWRTFCESVLCFEVPEYARALPTAPPAGDGDSGAVATGAVASPLTAGA